MAAAISLSPAQPRHRQTVTVTGSGFTPSTAYTVQVAQQSIGTQSLSVVSDGSGAFTCTFIANGAGSITVKAITVPSATSTAATSSATVAGD